MISDYFFSPLSFACICKRCLMWLTGYNFLFFIIFGLWKMKSVRISGLTSYLQTSKMLVCIWFGVKCNLFSEIYLMWLNINGLIQRFQWIQRFKFWSNFHCSPSICRCQDLSIKRKYLLLEQIWAFVKETSGQKRIWTFRTNRIGIFNWYHTSHNI